MNTPHVFLGRKSQAFTLLAILLVSLTQLPFTAHAQSIFVHYGDTWKYTVPVSDPGTSWRSTSYNDSSWGSGSGLLGFDPDSIPSPGIQTVIGAANSPNMTYLFRRTFTFNGNPSGMRFSIDHIVDDGATYYLNGNLLGSSRHNPGAWNGAASDPVGNAVEESNIIYGNATGLVNGTNVLAAEVHQIAPNGSDLVFGARLKLNSTPADGAAWRLANFSSMANAGNGADLADPDKDGLVNLLEYALAENPNQTTRSPWGSAAIEGGNYVLIYSRRKSSLNEITYSVQWANTPGNWTTSGITEQVTGDDGYSQTVKATISLAGGTTKFFRLLVTRVPVPFAPSTLQATTVSSSQINLSWADHSSDEVNFRIERKTTGAYAQIASLSANTVSFQDTGLSGGTTYYYRIYATNAAGNSIYTTEVSTTTTASSGNPYYNFNFQPIPDSTWPADNKIVIQAGQTRAEQWLHYGGSICWVSLNGGGNMVNIFDLGRQIVIPLWMGPQPYSPAGYDKPPVHSTFAHNPLQTGDAFGNPSQVLNYGYESGTSTHYIKVRAKAFPLRNYNTGVIYEVWSRPVGNAVRYWYKITVDRNNDADPILTRFVPLPQEFPCMHATTDFPYLTFYDGNQPFTNGALSQRDIPGLGYANGQPISENWWGLFNGSGQGLAVHGPHIWTAMGKKDGTEGSGPYGDNTIYANNPMTIVIDPVMTLYTVYDVMAVNTPSDIRNHAASNTASRPNNNLPEYEFSQSRQYFYTQNATMNDEITGGKLVVTHANMQARLFSPPKAFPANQVPTIYLRIRNNSPETELYFVWRCAGQNDQQSSGQHLTFSVPNDGQWHVRSFNMTQQSRWENLISYYGIQQQNAPENTPVSGRNWEVTHFGSLNPN